MKAILDRSISSNNALIETACFLRFIFLQILRYKMCQYHVTVSKPICAIFSRRRVMSLTITRLPLTHSELLQKVSSATFILLKIT